MSAGLPSVIAMATRCSSPPESSSMSRSTRCPRSSWSSAHSRLSRSCLFSMIWRTGPFTARGMWSTYCGLMIAFRSSSSSRVK
mmetsp:Transcript_18599/g.32495  ORF Transcript_18599/g.32495 Transcript_18599/m.32495 type:complete len:83 (+) Transcript_18599:815-1063(+)